MWIWASDEDAAKRLLADQGQPGGGELDESQRLDATAQVVEQFSLWMEGASSDDTSRLQWNKYPTKASAFLATGEEILQRPSKFLAKEEPETRRLDSTHSQQVARLDRGQKHNGPAVVQLADLWGKLQSFEAQLGYIRDEIQCQNGATEEKKSSTQGDRIHDSVLKHLAYCEEDFEDQIEIGRGGFGMVYRAKHRRFANDYAIKYVDALGMQLFVDEVEYLRRATAEGGRYVVPIHGYFAVQDPDRPLALIMSLAPLGSLEEFSSLVKRLPLAGSTEHEVTLNQLLGQSEMQCYLLVKMLKDVAKALEHLHSLPKPILHGDLKPSNILLFPPFEAKLCDFGSACDVAPGNDRLTAKTRGYIPPEVKRGEAFVPASDCWCFGKILGEAVQCFSVEDLPDDVMKHLEKIYRVCVSEDMSRRYGTTRADPHKLTDALEAVDAGRIGHSELPAFSRALEAHVRKTQEDFGERKR
eukprot:scaffold3039_cov194-Pinguiococcus_pyrenoidosus.AAC.4